MYKKLLCVICLQTNRVNNVVSKQKNIWWHDKMEFINEKIGLKSSDIKSANPSNNFVMPFYLTGSPIQETPKIRGRICRLTTPITQIIDRHNYPDTINLKLAEAMAITACLSTTFKLNGVITLQAKGDGPLRTLFCDVSKDGHIRSYAAFDENALGSEQILQDTSLTTLMGGGYMAFTIEQDGPNKRYQGIVELCGKTVKDSVIAWFKNSEQINTEFISMARKQDGSWVAATLLLQKLADKGGLEDILKHDDIETWKKAKLFANSSTISEMLNPNLKLEILLFRLFNELGVYIQPSRLIIDRCRCNNDKVETLLRSISKDELVNLVDENDNIVVDCEFCKKRRIFSSNLKVH